MSKRLKCLTKKFDLRMDPATLQMYSTDASIYQCKPSGVFFPRGEEEIVAIVRECARRNIPLLPRCAGTSLNGQAITGGAIIDLNAFQKLEIRGETATCGPAVVLERLDVEAGKHGLRFGPMPASANRATIGGLMGNNGTGAHSILYGMAEDHLLSARVLLSTGEIRTFRRDDLNTMDGLTKTILSIVDAVKDDLHWPRTWRNASGYNLRKINERRSLLPLFCGSEGHLGIMLDLKVSLVKKPDSSQIALFYFDDLVEAMKKVPEIIDTKPSAIELMDRTILRLAAKSPRFELNVVEGDPAAILIVEYEDIDAGDIAAKLGARQVVRDKEKQAEVWNTRKEGLGILMSTRSTRRPISFIEDYAVPVAQLPVYVERLRTLIRNHGVEGAYYAHASAGCLHIRPLLDLHNPDDRKKMKKILDDTVELVSELNGTLSGEHGDGRSKSPYLERLFGKDIVNAFDRVQKTLDPSGIFRPVGKTLFRADSLQTREFSPVLRWPDGYFNEVERCNGEATCKKTTGVMCPSYQVTGDEFLSTRGRANLLRAWLAGEAVEKALDETLSKCLSCKGCSHDCPSEVDMALMKSEYKNHRPHSLRDYFFSYFDELSRLGRVLGIPFQSTLKRVMGIHPDAEIHPPVGRGFLQRARARCTPGTADALLFVDTHIEYYDPAIGSSIMKCAEAAGLSLLPIRPGCCGRPAFSRGMLKMTRKHLGKFLDIPGTRPVIVVEPSCLSMLRDDGPKLLQELKPVSERFISVERFFLDHIDSLRKNLQRPVNETRVLFHSHCHQKAVRQNLEAVELLSNFATVTEIDAGCCGMAGSFGYEKKNFELSMDIARDRFLPVLRNAGDALIALPGRSCREMALRAGITGRHPIEILADWI